MATTRLRPRRASTAASTPVPVPMSKARAFDDVKAGSGALATRSIERQHKLCRDAFAQAMFGGQGVEFGDQLAVPTEFEVDVNALFDSDEIILLEARGGGASECEVSEAR